MLVSGVTKDNFSLFENNEFSFSYLRNKNLSATDNKNKAFKSAPLKELSAELFESINEWKMFCQNQILANNVDYLA